MNVHQGLKASYLANHLTDEEVQSIASLAKEKSYKPGEILVRQFDKDSDLMIVLEGTVRIESSTGERLAAGGAGSVFGEISLLDDEPRSATVVCEKACRVAVIPAHDFWKLLKEDAVLARTVLINIGHVLCTRIRGANMNLDTIVVDNAPIIPLAFWWHGL